MASQLPDHLQRAVRLGVTVFIACVVGYGIVAPEAGIYDEYPDEIAQAAKWSAITAVVVSAPVIGKVAQTGFERILGTIIGGWLGYGTFMVGRLFWNETFDGLVLSVAAFLVAASHVVIGYKLSLENSTKLYALTFLLVTFGSHDPEGALTLTITRISGIVSGVVLSLITAVLIFPKSATEEALANMRKSLESLTKLNKAAWQHGALYKVVRHAEDGGAAGPGKQASNGYWRLPSDEDADAGEEGKFKSEAERQAWYEEQCETLLMDTYNSLIKVADFMPAAKSEIYIGMCCGHMSFLPGIPWLQLGRWRLPEKDMQHLATSVRKMARLLWALHLTFQEGFGEDMMAMLKQQYPSRLMPQLVQASQGALQDLLEAFPNSAVVPSTNLHSFLTAVEGLIRISDYQRRRMLSHMRHFRRLRPSNSRKLHTIVVQAQARNALNGSSNFSAQTSPAASERFVSPRTNSLQPFFSTKSELGPVDGSELASPLLSYNRSGGDAAVGSPSRTSQTRRDQPHRPNGTSRAVEGESPSLDFAVMEKPEEEHVAVIAADVENVEPAASYQQPRSEAAAVTGATAASDQPSAASSGVTAEETSSAPEKMSAMASTSFGSAVSGTSPADAFNRLPEGLKIEIMRSTDLHSTPSLILNQEANSLGGTGMSITLPRVNSSELILFPDSEEGHVSMVRWCSFQFLVEEMAEELQEMHQIMSVLLKKLPTAKL
ncbi:hypothetical protein WJX72_007993 [[Myrmecia] bisecta]|uniref:Uncharacterized protein n=1 Tax=[Myrmecia] bisecta TaxID=41462 RepID=A0AAW1PAG5_9CHLO